ncbi:MAG: TonB-dependent receptor [Lentimicrobiaceae bacterium]|nr:TonB-dependent receptor [Lentimicrobiaceae bacterium]
MRNRFTKRLGRLVYLYFVWAGCLSFLYAQNTDSIHYLDEVSIKGYRRISPMENAATPVQALPETELLRLRSKQASEAVWNFAGVQLKDYGGVGGMKTVSVRSLGAAHTAVSYNGILLSDAQNGQIDLSKIYMDNLKSVALYNAQSASIFQPARNFQAAALLAIESRSVFESDSLRQGYAALTVGSFRQIAGTLSYAKKITPRFGLSANARYGYVYGNYPFEHDLGGSTKRLRRQNSDVQDAQAQIRMEYRPCDRHKIESELFYYGSERGLPGAVISYYPYSSQRLEDQDFYGVIKHRWQISNYFLQQNTVKYSFLYNRFQDPDALSAIAVDDRYRQQEVYLSTLTLCSPPVPGLSLSAALDAAFNFLGANRSDFADPWRSSLWFNIAADYRHPYVEVLLSGLTSAFFDRVKQGHQPPDKARFSPFASVAVFPLGKRSLALRVFYKDVFRMPTFNDFYYGRTGNTRLRPEKARQLDAGISYTLPAKAQRLWNMEVSADAYLNWVQDKIVAYPTDNLFVWSMFNVDKVRTLGVDAVWNIETAFAHSGIASRFGLLAQVAYTFLQALDKTSPQSPSYNQQVAYTPKHSGTAVISLRMPYVDLGYRISYCGERYILNQNIAENRLAPYMEHNLSLHAKIGFNRADLDLGFEVLNLSDETYQIVKNYPMPGRHYRLTVGCRF